MFCRTCESPSAVCYSENGQPNRSAIEWLHSGWSAYVITVSPVPGKNAWLLINTIHRTGSFKYTVRPIGNYIIAFVDRSLVVFAYSNRTIFAKQNWVGFNVLNNKWVDIIPNIRYNTIYQLNLGLSLLFITKYDQQKEHCMHSVKNVDTLWW